MSPSARSTTHAKTRRRAVRAGAIVALAALSACASNFDEPGDPLDVGVRVVVPDFPPSQVHIFCFPGPVHFLPPYCELHIWVQRDAGRAEVAARYCRVLARMRASPHTRTTDGRDFTWATLRVGFGDESREVPIPCPGDTPSTIGWVDLTVNIGSFHS
jgi:hypothetical protein